MKLSCTQENFNQGLSLVSHLAVKNTNLPITNNILIKTNSGGLLLAATNLEIGITCQIRAKIEENGIFTIPAGLITSFINLLKHEEKIDLALINKEIVITCGEQQTKIKGEDASEFPLLPEIKKENKSVVNNQDFKKALAQVVFAAALDETRVEISGVFLDFTEQGMLLATTDSYRLAEKKISLKEKKYQQSIIIPIKTAQELLRVLNLMPLDENVEIYISDNQVLFSINNVELFSRLIEGNYPDYKQIIPKEHKMSAVADIKELVNATKQAALFSKTGINDINFKFNQEKQQIIINSNNNQLGENISTITAEIKGQNSEIVFNYRYLLDGLNNLDGEKVLIQITNHANPGVFKGLQDDEYVYIIMPIRQ